MSGVNKVILIGKLGKDPELRYTPNGQPVATFSLATDKKFKDRNGAQQQKTEWHNIVAWGKTGEVCNQYLSKGSTVYIEGEITYRSWDDKDGNKRYKTEIVASQVQFLSNGKSDKKDSGPYYEAGDKTEEQAKVEEDVLPF